MDNETQAQVLEGTTPTESAAADEAAEKNDTAPQVSGNEADEAAQAAEENNAEGGEVNENASTAEPILTVRFNHEDHALSMTEATELAQKGLKLDSISDMLNDISYLAAIQDKTPAELIKGYIEAGENLKRRELTDKYGEDSEVVEVLMEKFKNENQQKFTAAKETIKQKEVAAEQNLNQRIADDFQKMKADFPEITDYASLPTAVKRQAVNGTPLKYAYLEYKYAEERKATAAKEQAASAAKKSTGSMATDEGGNSAENALLKGLWN